MVGGWIGPRTGLENVSAPSGLEPQLFRPQNALYLLHIAIVSTFLQERKIRNAPTSRRSNCQLLRIKGATW
jgi:hypothetical protein